VRREISATHHGRPHQAGSIEEEHLLRTLPANFSGACQIPQSPEISAPIGRAQEFTLREDACTLHFKHGDSNNNQEGPTSFWKRLFNTFARTINRDRSPALPETMTRELVQALGQPNPAGVSANPQTTFDANRDLCFPTPGAHRVYRNE